MLGGNSQYRDQDSWKSHRVNRAPKITAAILAVNRVADCEIHVHISQRWFERNALHSAKIYFKEFGLEKSPNSVLIYVNLRTHGLAVIMDQKVLQKTGPKYLDDFVQVLRGDLQSTYYENAVSMGVHTLGVSLQKYFPKRTKTHSENLGRDQEAEEKPHR